MSITTPLKAQRKGKGMRDMASIVWSFVRGRLRRWIEGRLSDDVVDSLDCVSLGLLYQMIKDEIYLL